MQDISLHILDIIENSITAHASRINVQIVEDIKKDILQIKIDDNGKAKIISEKNPKCIKEAIKSCPVDVISE